MIIHSIRLKNIKSYGEGPEGAGITVDFQPGVNRVAGRNGHGKTSLIESLGYALFLSEPRFEENFRTETYLIRHGCTAAEIDVTFDHEGAIYRIERGLGSTNKRRAKVVDVSDGSISAEGDTEVADFIGALLKLPGQAQLAEIFTKLIGVKQGRLTWPFDSKPREAKSFFEPLFDVAVFRDCFDRLKPAVDAFHTQAQEQQRTLAVEEQKITERIDSVRQFADAKKAQDELEKSRTAAVKDRDAARIEKEKHETREKTLSEAKAAHEKATAAFTNAGLRRADADAQVAEAKVAAVTLSDSEPAHLAFQKAELELIDLEKQREKRDALQKQRDDAEGERKDRVTRAAAAREQALTFTQQNEEKARQLNGLNDQIEPLREKLVSSRLTFDQAQQAALTASQDRSVVQAWVKSLGGAVNKLGNVAAEISGAANELSAWDPSVLVAAQKAEHDASTTLKSAESDLTKARGLRDSLQKQLKDISGGMCPFLKESCRQFDPSKVQSDLDVQATVIVALERRVTESAPLYAAAKKNLRAIETSETRLGAKREQQLRNISKYITDFTTLLPAEVVLARDRLKTWQTNLADLPQMPSIPAGQVGSDQVADLQSSVDQFKATTIGWWNGADAAIVSHLQISDHEKTSRQTNQNALDHLSRQLPALQKEAANLLKNAEAKTEEAARLDAEIAVLAKQVESFAAQINPFAGLGEQIAARCQERDQNRAGHERYLQAKRLADDLPAREKRFLEREAEEKEAARVAKTAAAAMAAATIEFDAEKLAAAQIEFQQKHDTVTAIETDLKHALSGLPLAEKRVAEWNAACAERDRIKSGLARLEAAIELTELARRTLQKAAPAVAQHLCDRIASRAQALFNEINPDPIQLAWDAERYSLTITPGDRRFAMLSGGEQTKLALALTLAMIEEFGGLRFCIFDEPTYGVDAESRQKLADAILEVHKAAGLDQLILVSHDDAFDGRIEHSIMLTKSAAGGSAVALTS